MKRSNVTGCWDEADLMCLMQEYMVQKGTRYLAWNERLKQDPDAEVPAESYARGSETIDHASRRQHRGRTIRRAIGIAAAVIVGLMLVGGTALAVSPELRERVFHLFIMEKGEGQVDFSLGKTEDAGIDPLVVYHYSEPAVPEGYVEMREDRSESGSLYIRVYYYEDGSVIGVYLISAADNMQWGAVSSEADVQEPVIIHDFEGIYVELSQFHSIQFLLADTVHGAYVRVSGEGVSADLLREIVEQLHYVGE